MSIKSDEDSSKTNIEENTDNQSISNGTSCKYSSHETAALSLKEEERTTEKTSASENENNNKDSVIELSDISSKDTCDIVDKNFGDSSVPEHSASSNPATSESELDPKTGVASCSSSLTPILEGKLLVTTHSDHKKDLSLDINLLQVRLYFINKRFSLSAKTCRIIFSINLCGKL